MDIVSYIIVCVSVVWLAALILGLVLLSRHRVGAWDERKSLKNGGMIACAVISGIFGVFGLGLAVYTVILMIVRPYVGGMAAPLVLSLIGAAVLFGVFGAAIGAIRKNKKLARFFFGSTKPMPGAMPLYSFAAMNADQLRYLSWRKAYRDRRKKEKTLAYEKRCFAKKKLPSKPVLWLIVNRVWLSVAAALLVVAIVLVCVLVPVLGNKFRVEVVKKIELGNGQYTVEQILGEPDEQSETRYVWYDDAYKSLRREAEEIADRLMQAEDLSEIERLSKEAEAVQERLDALVYSAITVEFEGSRAVCIRLDADAGSGAQKELVSVTVTEGAMERYMTVATIEYEATFADGSFLRAEAEAVTETAPVSETSVPVTWGDLWCDAYEADIPVTENERGYYIEGTTLHILSDNGVYAAGVLDEAQKAEIAALVVEEGVTEIGRYSFDGYTALAQISLPGSLRFLGSHVFNETAYYNDPANWSGSALYIGDCLIEADPSGPFAIAEGTRLLAESAFWCAYDLTDVTIPEGVQYIGDSAFGSCNSLRAVQLPASVVGIAPDAFSGCVSLESLSVREGNAVYHSAGDCVIETATGTLLFGCNNSVIPQDGSIRRIGAGAFYGCSGLTEATIPASVESVGESAFEDSGIYLDADNWEVDEATGTGALYLDGCLLCVACEGDGAASFAVREGTRLIADRAFREVWRLEEVTLPASLRTIGEDVFLDGGGYLQRVVFAETDGWSVTGIDWNEEEEVRLSLSAEDLSDPERAAYMLSYGYYPKDEPDDDDGFVMQGEIELYGAVWRRG